jgi:hypothetical protein
MNSLRKMLESTVTAWNTPLRDAVKSMSNVILLRNCAPSERSFYAFALYRNGMLTKDEAKEFVPILTI